MLGFVVYPVAKERGLLRWLDAIAIVLVVWSSGRILSFDYQSIEHLLNGLQRLDFAAGMILVIATLEMARRAVGPVMMWVGLVFLLYGAFGNVLPDVLATKGFRLSASCAFRYSLARDSSALH